MAAPDPLDLHHLGDERVIGVYLLETEDGLALQDCGPSTCIPALKERLAERGLALDGSPAPAALAHPPRSRRRRGRARPRASRAPGARVRDRRAARRRPEPPRGERAPALRGRVRPLWGELAPVPEQNVHVVGEKVLGLECFPSPGHAAHHVCYLDGEGTLYAGDAAGVRIMPDRHIWPVAPPPEVDLDAWERTIDELELRAPERLALIHFGVVDQPRDHLRRLRRQLRLWGQRVRQGMDEDEFVEAARADLEDEAGRGAVLRARGAALAVVPRPQALLGQGRARRPARSRRPSAPARSAPRRSAALDRVELVRLLEGRGHLAVVVDDDPAPPVLDHLGHGAVAGRDHRRPAGHRLDHDEAERLLPLDREERRARVLEQLDLLAVRDLAQVLDPAVAEVRLDELGEVLRAPSARGSCPPSSAAARAPSRPRSPGARPCRG